MEHGYERVPGEKPHPGARQYLGIALILLIITIFEVAIFYIPGMKVILVPSLLVLSAAKFALVAMFYMHLKFDHPMFSWLFVLPLLLAAAVILALMLLFGVI
jgi:hypothetical protein